MPGRFGEAMKRLKEVAPDLHRSIRSMPFEESFATGTIAWNEKGVQYNEAYAEMLPEDMALHALAFIAVQVEAGAIRRCGTRDFGTWSIACGIVAMREVRSRGIGTPTHHLARFDLPEMDVMSTAEIHDFMVERNATPPLLMSMPSEDMLDLRIPKP